MTFSARQLSETGVQLIENYIKDNITAALAAVAAIRPGDVTTESPSSESYFPYFKAHGYRCPAIFVVDDGMDFRQSETKANFINAMFSVNVSVKVEDKTMDLLTVKAWRYQAALHSLLDQTTLATQDGKVNLVSRVRKIEPDGPYTYGNDEADETATFFKEYMLKLDVEFFENF